MGHTFTSKITIFLFFVITLRAVEGGSPAQCFAEFVSGIQNGSWGLEGAVDYMGNPAQSLSAVEGYSYFNCTSFCGTGPDAFSWSDFSQQFSAWLLPWLALVSQLPFGGRDRLDNVMAVILAIGSPMLAAYSLALTLINGRWLARHFAGISYPNAIDAFHVLNSLQQAPLSVSNQDSLLMSLVVLPENDKWWGYLKELLHWEHTWNIAAATSIGWVFISYIFTVIDAFDASTRSSGNGVSDGQATGSVWLWLLPVVIGWLQLSPKCDDARLRRAIGQANRLAYVADEDSDPVLAERVSAARAFSLLNAGLIGDAAQDDALCSAPIYNYARLHSWTLCTELVVSVFRKASRQADARLRADGRYRWRQADEEQLIHPDNRRATRRAIEEFCADAEGGPAWARTSSHWGSNTISRILLASFMAATLQWGTAGAALIIHVLTPPPGLGCRSALIVMYGVTSTIIWGLLITSSALAHYSLCVSPARNPELRRNTRRMSLLLRRSAKLLAIANSLCIVMTTVAEFSNFLNRCWCNTLILDVLRNTYGKAYVVVFVPASQSRLLLPWTSGLTLGLGCTGLFVLFVNLFLNPLP
ncbi:hypothetical protein C8F04DRAFT_1116865 [Mycena alexandri]|uniref:Uncharacterized protein n=1 Tax=Mycena alexandri TaxID=1745969 RepID=A0AAD6SLL6_9AGAR|nr:hypothetical protein C8F04DRAFT_1116865 [Mycena alexandri]